MTERVKTDYSVSLEAAKNLQYKFAFTEEASKAMLVMTEVREYLKKVAGGGSNDR